MNIYIGNLPDSLTNDELYMAFKAFGQVQSATIVRDKFTMQSRGFAFVEMPNKEEAEKAISALNGSDLKGKTVKVNEARPKDDNSRGGRPGGGGGGGSRGGYGGGGGGGRRW
jgi:cold-inducible RNA-binding protein